MNLLVTYRDFKFISGFDIHLFGVGSTQHYIAIGLHTWAFAEIDLFFLTGSAEALYISGFGTSNLKIL